MSESPRARILVTVIVALFVVTGLAVPPASAFTFEQIGGFIFGQESSTDGPQTGIAFFNSIGTPPDTWGTIGWGSQSGPSFTTSVDPFSQTGPGDADRRSALRLDTFSGVINPGDTVILSHLTHANRAILEPFLIDSVISTRLRLFDGATIVLEDVSEIPSALTETANLSSEAACDPSTHIAGTMPCSDYFLFPFGTFEDVTFSANGQSYVLTFGLVPGPGTLFEVVSGECDPSNGTGGGDVCGRVRTAEFDENSIDITATLNQVASPGSMVLLGFGVALAGLFGIRRRVV